MRFRFRYQRPDGRAVQVATIEGLRDLLRRGEVAPDTLLFDALTGEWAPLRAHAVVRLLEDVGDVEAPATPSPSHLDMPGLDLTLSEEEEAPSAAETIRELLKEREREDEARPADDLVGFSEPAEWSSGVVVDAGVEGSPPSSPARSAPAGAAATSGIPAQERRPDATTSVAEAARASAAPSATQPPPSATLPPEAGRTPLRVPLLPPRAGPRLRAPSRFVAIAGGVGLVAMLAYTIGWSEDRPVASEPLTSVAPPPPPPASDTRDAIARLGASGAGAVALSDMVEALDSLRRARRLDDLPRDWLEGIYLAEASRYPEVRSYWERYRTFVSDVRQRDTALFRQSFVRRLEAEGVSGAMVPMRLASAIRLFEASQPARDTVYDAMAGLAQASLDLHDLLVEREADIVYDPVLPDRFSKKPVVEAFADDPLLHEHMWMLLDRIFFNLSILSGGEVGTRDALTERSLDGIRARGGV